MHPNCRVLIVMGKTDPAAAAPHRQQSMVIVPIDAPGVRVVRNLAVFGYHDREGHAEVEFDNVHVPASDLLKGEGEGFAIGQARLGRAASTTACVRSAWPNAHSNYSVSVPIPGLPLDHRSPGPHLGCTGTAATDDPITAAQPRRCPSASASRKALGRGELASRRVPGTTPRTTVVSGLSRSGSTTFDSGVSSPPRRNAELPRGGDRCWSGGYLARAEA